MNKVKGKIKITRRKKLNEIPRLNFKRKYFELANNLDQALFESRLDKQNKHIRKMMKRRKKS